MLNIIFFQVMFLTASGNSSNIDDVTMKKVLTLLQQVIEKTTVSYLYLKSRV